MLKTKTNGVAGVFLQELLTNGPVLEKFVFTKSEFKYTKNAKNHIIPFDVTSNNEAIFRTDPKPAVYQKNIMYEVSKQDLSPGKYIVCSTALKDMEIYSLENGMYFRYYPSYGNMISANKLFVIQAMNFLTGKLEYFKVRETSGIPAMKYVFDRLPLYVKDPEKIELKSLEFIFSVVEYTYGFPMPTPYEIELFCKNIEKMKDGNKKYDTRTFSEMYSVIEEEYEDEQDYVDGAFKEELSDFSLTQMRDNSRTYDKILAGTDMILIPDMANVEYAKVVDHKLFIYTKNISSINLPEHMKTSTFILPYEM